MKNYLYDIFYDLLLSVVTRKYGTKLNDEQRENKVDEMIGEMKALNKFTVDSTQALIDKKGLNGSYSDSINGQSVYCLYKEGMFKKKKVCYFITRVKDELTTQYLDQVYEELRRQANGENVFNSPEYKNG